VLLLRSALLSKAKKAIEALKMRIEELQASENRNRDIEAKFINLQQSQSVIENSYQLQVQELSEQLSRCRESLSQKESERNLAEDKLVSSSVHTPGRDVYVALCLTAHARICLCCTYVE
jgi:uncharacterized protein YPO0396